MQRKILMCSLLCVSAIVGGAGRVRASEVSVLKELRDSHPDCVLHGHFYVSQCWWTDLTAPAEFPAASVPIPDDDFAYRIVTPPIKKKLLLRGDFGTSLTSYTIRAR